LPLALHGGEDGLSHREERSEVKRIGRYGQDWSGLGYGWVAGFYERGNEPSGSRGVSK